MHDGVVGVDDGETASVAGPCSSDRSRRVIYPQRPAWDDHQLRRMP